MPETYEIGSSYIENAEGFEGTITVKFSGLSFERKKELEGRIRGVAKYCRGLNGRIQKGNPATLMKRSTDVPPVKNEQPGPITRGPPVRGPQMTGFLKDLNCPEAEVLVEFDKKFNYPGNIPERVLQVWRKYHPAKSDVPAKPAILLKVKDKIRCIRRPDSPTGIIEEISPGHGKMLVRFGINDMKYCTISDYEVVPE